MKKKRIKLEGEFTFIEGLILGFLFTTAIILLTLFIYVYLDNKDYSINSEVEDVGIKEIINNCKGKDIIKSSECVNAHVRAIYSYNISNLGKDLSFNQLKETGGVCSHWSTLLCQIGNELGFYTKEVEIKTGFKNLTINNVTKEYTTEHIFCVWSAGIDMGNSYIILDQRTIFVFKFGRDE